jgi:hypothetical protein
MFFVLQWFFAHYMYQEALRYTEAGIVHVLYGTSGLFTLICAAVYPSSQGDRFTLTKLAAVLVRWGKSDQVCHSYVLLLYHLFSTQRLELQKFLDYSC